MIIIFVMIIIIITIVNINHVDIERLFQGHQRILKTGEDEDKHH